MYCMSLSLLDCLLPYIDYASFSQSHMTKVFLSALDFEGPGPYTGPKRLHIFGVLPPPLVLNRGGG